MKYGLRLPIAVLVVALAVSLLAAPSLAFSGELRSDLLPPGIVGTGFWVTTGPVHLEWSVNPDMGVPGLWNYSYRLTVPDGDISHFILECSNDLRVEEIVGLSGTFTDIEINDFSAAGPGGSNPNIPGPIHGIKFDMVDTTTGIFSFKTFREPVWGDFYAKNGTAHNDPDVFNTAWNAGFLDPDPTDPPSDGSINFHVLVPDTGLPVIPDASTLFLASLGALPLLAMRRKVLR